MVHAPLSSIDKDVYKYHIDRSLAGSNVNDT